MKKLIVVLLAVLLLAGCSNIAGNAQAGIGAGRYTSLAETTW